MSNARNNNLQHLHPVFRAKVADLLTQLSQENIPFRLFEGFRSAQRQQYLYEQGRTRSGAKVTNARAWQSYHQYGVGADFVLFENGKWSWDDKGPKAPWWDRLHALGAQVGLEPLSFEKPHLQLQELKMSDLQAGRYPGGGDEDWAENLENGILTWSGSPNAPPVPDILASRPPLGPLSVPPFAMASAPALGSSDWHQMFGGREWRFDETGVYTMDFENGEQPWRTPGVPATCRKIVELCLDEILAASEKHQIPPALIIMTIATETGFARNLGFTGPQTFRWEPHVEVTDVNPHLKGDYSAGPMQTLATTARWIIRVQSLDYDPFQVAPVYEYQPEPPANHSLYDYAVNIDIGAAEIKQRWKKTGADPVLVAAAYNAGGLYEEEKNPWHLRCYGDHLNRAAQWFGDACAVLKELGV